MLSVLRMISKNRSFDRENSAKATTLYNVLLCLYEEEVFLLTRIRKWMMEMEMKIGEGGMTGRM